MPRQDDSDCRHFPRPHLTRRLAGAVLFYTRIPLPARCQPSFDGIAAFAPMVGMVIGGLLVLVDSGLHRLGIPPLLQSGIVVALWVWLTGGLHLDGAMDTADGLAVTDPTRRLEVMADSRTGAFGTLAAIAILGLKTIALGELTSLRALLLLVAPLWGRWGQVIAIVRYPYLKDQGKGALHKASLRLPQDWLWGFATALLLHGLYARLYPAMTVPALIMFPVGAVLSIITAAWFNRRLGGHTGDSYGAVVEWTEVLMMCIAVGLQNSPL